MANRRELLRMFGTAAGGALLSSCGSNSGPAGTSGGGPRTALPNGLACQPIVSRDGGRATVLPDLAKLSPSILMNDSGDVWLCGFDSSEEQGLWHLKLDLRTATPTVLDQRRLLRTGQSLAGGRLERIFNVDANNEGGVVASLQVATQVAGLTKSMAGVHYAMDGNSFEPMLTWGTKVPTPGGQGQVGATIGDVDVHDGHNLLVSSQFGTPQNKNMSGVYYLPSGSVAGAQLILHSQATVPQTGGTLAHFGLLDLHTAGHYVVQAYSPAGFAGGPQGQETTSVILAGRVGEGVARARLVAAEPSLRAGRAASQGMSVMGPRIGYSGQVAHVLHTSSTAHELRIDDTVVARTGTMSPRVKMIESIGPGVVCGKPGLCYFTLGTAGGGSEMCVSNGLEVHTVLATGDPLAGHTVDTIYQGFHSSQSDKSGRVLFAVQYGDGGRAIVLGTPA